MFVAVKAPNGKRMLINLELTFCYVEEDNGTASAVSIAGTKAATGETFDTILSDMEPEK